MLSPEATRSYGLLARRGISFIFRGSRMARQPVSAQALGGVRPRNTTIETYKKKTRKTGQNPKVIRNNRMVKPWRDGHDGRMDTHLWKALCATVVCFSRRGFSHAFALGEEPGDTDSRLTVCYWRYPVEILPWNRQRSQARRLFTNTQQQHSTRPSRHNTASSSTTRRTVTDKT